MNRGQLAEVLVKYCIGHDDARDKIIFIIADWHDELNPNIHDARAILLDEFYKDLREAGWVDDESIIYGLRRLSDDKLNKWYNIIKK